MYINTNTLEEPKKTLETPKTILDNSKEILVTNTSQTKLTDSVKTSVKEAIETNPVLSVFIAGLALSKAYIKRR